MVNDTNTQEGASTRTLSLSDRTRRAVLKLAGVGAGLGALGGASMSTTGDQHEPDSQADDGDSDDHFVADLIDPTFGYPLAADETDDVDLEPAVELVTNPGEGAHADFPQMPEGEGDAPGEFFFDPVGLHVEPDDLVQFRVAAGEHTATAFHEKFSVPHREMPTRVPDGVPGFTSPPIMGGESWLYQFSSTGVYDLLCLPHLFFGMVMRVVVFDPDADDIGADRFTAPTAGDLPPNAARVLTADELAPANIVEQGTVAWDELTIDGQSQAAAPTVQVRDQAEHGDILVGPDGMTLYMFDQDTQGDAASTCQDGCAEAWPPLTVDGEPTAGDQVEAELTTFEREDGSTQVAADGWPLYYFAQDADPGDVAGQGVDGFGDTWWVLQPDGTPIRSESTE